MSEAQCTEMETLVIVIGKKRHSQNYLQKGQPGRVKLLFDMQEAASHRKKHIRGGHDLALITS